MTAWLKEVLEISVRTSISCTAQSLSTWPGMLSGPTALHGLILHRVLRQLEIDRAPGHLEMCAVLVQVCRSVSQIVSRRGWVHLAGMCHRHWPVAGACDGLNGLPQGPGHCHWSYCWFFWACWCFAFLRAALSPDLNASSQIFSSPWTSAVIHGF